MLLKHVPGGGLALFLALALPPTAAPGQVVRRSGRAVAETRVERIEPAAVAPEAGFCYTAVLHLRRPGDSGAGSDCVLTEDGQPLGPAHATHADIRAKGRGAYSHWTAAVLYFSASDNSDPRKNGRSYALVSRSRVVRQTAVVTLNGPSASYEIRAAGKTADNRRLTLRNLDPRAALTPYLRERGSPDLRSREGMIRSLLTPGMTPEQKSLAVWKFLVDRRYHYLPAEDGPEVHDPVKFLGVYGYGFCDDSARNFAALCETAGLKARVWGLNGHVVAESFYDVGWHMFDPDMECYFRGPGGRILGVEDLGKDPSAITARPATPSSYPSAEVAKFYATTADNAVWPPEAGGPAHRIEPVLQPGDVLTFDLGPALRVHNVFEPAAALPPLAANGTLRREVEVPAGGSEVLIPVDWPYVIVGGELAVPGGPGAEIRVSADGAGWAPVPTLAEGPTTKADFSPWVAARKTALYGLSLRIRSVPGKGVLTLRFQFAPRALPAVRPGTTTFDLTLAPARGLFPAVGKGVEITHEWDEPGAAE